MADVIVIGAGMAGAAAALRLGRSGQKPLVLEAQDRIGGRAFSRHYAAHQNEDLLEYGGSWITPYHHRIRAHVAELGLRLRPRARVVQRLAWRDGRTALPGFATFEERQAHERAIARIAADSMLCKMGHAVNENGQPLIGITFKTYLDRIGPPQATLNLLQAWWTVSGSGAHDVVAASEFLSSCAYGGGLAEAMIDVWTETVEPGMSVLAERLLQASGAEVRMPCPVARIEQTERAIAVITRAGETLQCRHAIVAIGTNPMVRIEFSPSLSGTKAQALSAGHAGKAFKLWIKARGIPVGTLITGDGTGIQMLLAERLAADGCVLLIGFGLHLDGSMPGDGSWVRAQLARLVPNAEFISHDWHDWLADPFAMGTWVSAPAHIAGAFEAEAWHPEGRIAFASSDYAPEQAGWFEGAIRSGEAAADWVLMGLAASTSTSRSLPR